jgi:hypothetical protein
MSINVFIWICSAVFVFTFLAIYLQVKRHIVNPILKDKDATLDTDLGAFRESNTYDGIVKGANKSGEASISELFEEMCILNPANYEEDSRIPKVLKDYKDLLHGRIEDPDGKHIPSEILLGIRNTDYGIYLKSQIRVLKKKDIDVSWFKEEFKRFNQNDKEELFEADFFMMLEKMGAPHNILGALVNDKRMETYSPEDWKVLVDKVKEYDKTYSDDDLIFFLDTVENRETLLNENKMEAFSKLRELGFDEKLAAAYIEDDISSEDLEEVSELMDKFSMSCDEALESYLTKKEKSLKTLSLQEKYRRQVLS